MTHIMPMMPNEISESFFASSSILSCSGVRFSSTCRELRSGICMERKRAYILHHGEYYAKLSLGAGRDDHARASAYSRVKIARTPRGPTYHSAQVCPCMRCRFVLRVQRNAARHGRLRSHS